MPSATNLRIGIQSGSDGKTWYAVWDFRDTIVVRSASDSGGFKIYDWVTIKEGATYYNGTPIPDDIRTDSWQISQISGDKAILEVNHADYILHAPINVSNLVSADSGGSGPTVSQDNNYLDHFEVAWYYSTGDGIWFEGSTTTTTNRQSVYSLPENAYNVKVSVLPVAQTHEVNEEEVAYWIGSWVTVTKLATSAPPETLSAPTVEIDKYQLTATIENISDYKVDEVDFEIYAGDSRYKTARITVKNRRATYVTRIASGEDYRVRIRGVNIFKSERVLGEWSEYSSSVATVPTAIAAIFTVKAASETSVYLSWAKIKNATSYDIEYTTDEDYFDSTNEVQSMSVDAKVTYATVTGLSTGDEYFFRVRPTNSVGSAEWSIVTSIVIGKKPAAPTTWSSTTTAVVGEDLMLYWVHNAQDGSSQTFAELELTIDGRTETKTIKNTENEDEKDKTSFYQIDTSSYKAGAKILWRVRTAGITKEYGDWSVQRTIDIYTPPSISVSIVNKDGKITANVKTFPFYLNAKATGSNQTVIGYYVDIVSQTKYETTDNVGRKKTINIGESVYSKYFDTSDTLMVEFTPTNIDLCDQAHYIATATVSMDSGLTAEDSCEFWAFWDEHDHEPDAEIGIDKDTYTAYISPYCVDDKGKPYSDVRLSIYRKEFDGTFTEIATGIENTSGAYVVDPHPALDYARYRIVSVSKTTGVVNYYDPPGYPVHGKAIIIQWDEEWTDFNASTGDKLEEQPWTGSMLLLPYNIDVSDANSPDVSLVSYIGRSYPVSYYGTYIGSTATWNLEIPKEDKDTLYAIRRLAIWMGDVYVREPSGTGYWARITVTYSQKHKEVTIPVTLNVTRVEGGL